MNAGRRICRGWRSLVGLVALTLTVGALGLTHLADNAVAEAPAPAVTVFPIPGSRVASPQTQIAFRGVAPSALGAVQVVGSQSGSHLGQIEADSDGQGASFLPAQAFNPGETVTVTTALNVVGAPGGTFQFQVATPATQIPHPGPLRVPRVPGGVWRFRSRPDLAPPAVTIQREAGGGGGDDIFLTPQYGPVQNGPEILDPHGELIWFDRVPPGNLAANLQVQRYRGQPVLTWWQGYTDLGTGIGEDVIADTAYRQIVIVHGANGLNADLHEFTITPWGSALITAYYPVIWNAAAVHGSKREIVFDSVVQEIDISTGLVLFQWDSLDHVPVTESYQPLPLEGPKVGFHNPYDYFHVNSIQVDGDGTLLVSARNTWAVYKVNLQTGAIIWRLGGRHSSFRMLGDAGFAFQHDVHSRASGDRFLTLFDDGAGLPAIHNQSRALELILDLKHHTARVFKEWEHSPRLLSLFEGNVQQLADNHEFVGWGQNPFFTEFDQRGRIVLDGRFVSNTASYRAFRFPWSATPATPPAVVTTSGGRRTTVYVSWDGATGVSSWRVLEGPTPTSLRPVITVRKRSFETVITVRSAPFLRVVPLGARGHELTPSPAVGSVYTVPAAAKARTG